MDSGYYAACSALKTQTNALEIAANNIANVSTAGYRGQVPSFQALLAQNGGPRMGAWERLVNEHAVLNFSRLDLGQGNLEPTGNPMDFAISGPGFFAVQTKAGTMYTRNGSFQVSARGQLVTTGGIRCWEFQVQSHWLAASSQSARMARFRSAAELQGN